MNLSWLCCFFLMRDTNLFGGLQLVHNLRDLNLRSINFHIFHILSITWLVLLLIKIKTINYSFYISFYF